MSLYNGNFDITDISLKLVSKEISIKFYQWMKENDNLENSEKYCNKIKKDL
jgi:hypothetical protein